MTVATTLVRSDRFVAFAAMVVLVLVAGPLYDISNTRPDPVLANLLAVMGKPLLRLLAILIAAAGITAWALLPARKPPPGMLPAVAVEHVSTRAKPGNIYNDHVFGYLIFRGIPTFIMAAAIRCSVAASSQR